MKRKKHSAEQVIQKLRAAERMAAQDKKMPEILAELQVSEQTFYRWRRQYGAMSVDQAKELKRLEQENARLKRLVADQALDISMLKEITEGKW